MLHKVSDLCDRVDAIKSLSDTLRLIKYGEEWIVEADTENEALDSQYYSRDPDYEGHTTRLSIDIEEMIAE